MKEREKCELLRVRKCMRKVKEQGGREEIWIELEKEIYGEGM